MSSDRVCTPADYPQVEGPMVFLAGPITNGPDWQSEAVRLLHRQRPELWIANPRHELFGVLAEEEQIDWETAHLRLAGRAGVVLFWCANEIAHSCDRPYGQTTRFELGEWHARARHEPVKLALGIEPGFSNESYIRRRFGQDLPQVRIQASLAATVSETLRLLDELAQSR